MGSFSIISPSISMMTMSEGNLHDLSSRDARERSNRCALPRRSSVLGAGSWRPFWFDHIFCSMIFGQVMAKIRHGGGSRRVAFRPFRRLSDVVCFAVQKDKIILIPTVRQHKKKLAQCHLFSALGRYYSSASLIKIKYWLL